MLFQTTNDSTSLSCIPNTDWMLTLGFVAIELYTVFKKRCQVYTLEEIARNRKLFRPGYQGRKAIRNCEDNEVARPKNTLSEIQQQCLRINVRKWLHIILVNSIDALVVMQFSLPNGKD